MNKHKIDFECLSEFKNNCVHNNFKYFSPFEMEWKELRQHHYEIVKRLWLYIAVNTLVLVM